MDQANEFGHDHSTPLNALSTIVAVLNISIIIGYPGTGRDTRDLGLQVSMLGRPGVSQKRISWKHLHLYMDKLIDTAVLNAGTVSPSGNLTNTRVRHACEAHAKCMCVRAPVLIAVSQRNSKLRRAYTSKLNRHVHAYVLHFEQQECQD